ncbi:hypothetical protein ABRQ05_08045 [Pectobacterium actinidiae]|uniref:hypothetical protein n=1 Tax=Pectobacterium actinidiae TaxID=1507808 RepID=UPI0032ED8F74
MRRLRNYTNGYGPKGAGFIGHVDIPDDVDAAWHRLVGETTLAGIVREWFDIRLHISGWLQFQLMW